jgi:hypothetical protein
MISERKDISRCTDQKRDMRGIAAMTGWSLVLLSVVGSALSMAGMHAPFELESRARTIVALSAVGLAIVGCGFMTVDGRDQRIVPAPAVLVMGAGLAMSTLLVVAHS